MTKIKYIIILLALIPIVATAQNRVKGVVRESGGEAVVGATIFHKERPATGTATDENGNFSLGISAKKGTLTISLAGYDTIDIAFDEQNRDSISVTLTGIEIEAIQVATKALTDRLVATQIGAEVISIKELAKTPSLFGERDVIKALTLLPGVKTESDASSGFQVRGGTSSQNLILLDDATIYNAGHLMGVFSAFNDEALQNATLYKGLIPAQFGDASSAVLDVISRSGNPRKHQFSASIGLLSAKASAEGPIVGDKLSYFASFRRSYADFFLMFSPEFKGNIMNFWDANAKLNYHIDSMNILTLSFYGGTDNMGMVDVMDMNWSNYTSSLKWLHRYNDILSSQTSLIWSNFNNFSGVEMREMNVTFEGFIKHYGLKHNFEIKPRNGKHLINVGLQSTLIDLESGNWTVNILHESEQRQAWKNNIWVNEEFKPIDNLTLSLGLRLSLFSVLGGAPYYDLDSRGDITHTYNYSKGEFVKTYANLEPRFSANWRISEDHSLKLGYSRTTQNIHAIRNASMSTPIDRYTMTSNIIKPQIADQLSLGYVAMTSNRDFEFSVEGYYKNIDNVYDYRDGKTFNSAIEIERILLGGSGRAYGVEFMVRKNLGRFTGWVGYTLSWSENRIDGINNSQWYTASNDRRHDISVVGMYSFGRGWDMSASWVYNTGQALTAPSGKYTIGSDVIYYFAERNGYRAPDYHRLDVSFSHTKVHPKYTRIWNFGVYNLYNHYNPFMIMFEEDKTAVTGTKTMMYSLFGILPSVSLTFKF